MIHRCDHLTRTYSKEGGFSLDVYEKTCDGYKAARNVLASMSPSEVVEEAKKANIRGRGGAGFPMGVKWSFMKPHPTKPAYLVVNADEGEPGTHKDRTIMERNPHAVVEGCVIGCYGIGAHMAYIYVRDELHLAKARLEGAIKEARAKGYLAAGPSAKSTPSTSSSTRARGRTSAARRPRSSIPSKANAGSRASSHLSPRRLARSAVRRR